MLSSTSIYPINVHGTSTILHQIGNRAPRFGLRPQQLQLFRSDRLPVPLIDRGGAKHPRGSHGKLRRLLQGHLERRPAVPLRLEIELDPVHEDSWRHGAGDVHARGLYAPDECRQQGLYRGRCRLVAAVLLGNVRDHLVPVVVGHRHLVSAARPRHHIGQNAFRFRARSIAIFYRPHDQGHCSCSEGSRTQIIVSASHNRRRDKL
mmetsp:Transcript_4429/g.6219  ORF Transcript_4429/g.6219 Transcript_4429/m.6219 type:complete len:205 (+) Transcript_4429:2-616(+)